MIGMKIEVPDLADLVRKQKHRLYMIAAATIQTNRAMMFDQEGANNGHPRWAPLKFRKGKILSDTGTLRKSIVGNQSGHAGPDGIVQFSGDKITIGTKLAYAAMMNYGTTQLPGGVLRPVKAKALKIPIGGDKFIFRKSAKIPARPFDQWSEGDEEELAETIKNALIDVLQGKTPRV